MDENEKQQPDIDPGTLGETVQESKMRRFFKEKKKIKTRTVIMWAIILVVVVIIANPDLLFFLPASAKNAVRDTWDTVFGDIGEFSDNLKLGISSIFRVAAIVVLIVAITTIVMFILDHIHPKRPKYRSIVTLIRSAVSYIAVLVGIFWCLSAIGVNVSTIFASVGIVALIIGFGAQSLVEDLITGIFLVFEDRFNVGDIIEVNGFRGTVESIGIRTTCISDYGNNVKIINNSDLRNILNRSTAVSLAATSVYVSYSTDIEKVEKILEKLLPRIKEKYPDVFVAVPTYAGVNELGESGVELKFFAQINESNIFKAPRVLNREIKICFDKEGIEIPFNQIVVHQAKD